MGTQPKATRSKIFASPSLYLKVIQHFWTPHSRSIHDPLMARLNSLQIAALVMPQTHAVPGQVEFPNLGGDLREPSIVFTQVAC
jgi:hypothetical protein